VASTLDRYLNPSVLDKAVRVTAPIKVIDADTINIGGNNVRLNQADAYETSKPNQAGQTGQAGRQAENATSYVRERLSDPNNQIYLQPVGKDEFRRDIDDIYIKESNGQVTDLSSELIRRGYALPESLSYKDRTFSDLTDPVVQSYIEDMVEGAKQGNNFLNKGSAQLPSEFRDRLSKYSDALSFLGPLTQPVSGFFANLGNETESAKLIKDAKLILRAAKNPEVLKRAGTLQGTFREKVIRSQMIQDDYSGSAVLSAMAQDSKVRVLYGLQGDQEFWNGTRYSYADMSHMSGRTRANYLSKSGMGTALATEFYKVYNIDDQDVPGYVQMLDVVRDSPTVYDLMNAKLSEFVDTEDKSLTGQVKYGLFGKGFFRGNENPFKSALLAPARAMDELWRSGTPIPYGPAGAAIGAATGVGAGYLVGKYLEDLTGKATARGVFGRLASKVASKSIFGAIAGGVIGGALGALALSTGAFDSKTRRPGKDAQSAGTRGGSPFETLMSMPLNFLEGATQSTFIYQIQSYFTELVKGRILDTIKDYVGEKRDEALDAVKTATSYSIKGVALKGIATVLSPGVYNFAPLMFGRATIAAGTLGFYSNLAPALGLTTNLEFEKMDQHGFFTSKTVALDRKSFSDVVDDMHVQGFRLKMATAANPDIESLNYINKNVKTVENFTDNPLITKPLFTVDRRKMAGAFNNIATLYQMMSGSKGDFGLLSTSEGLTIGRMREINVASKEIISDNMLSAVDDSVARVVKFHNLNSVEETQLRANARMGKKFVVDAGAGRKEVSMPYHYFGDSYNYQVGGEVNIFRPSGNKAFSALSNTELRSELFKSVNLVFDAVPANPLYLFGLQELPKTYISFADLVGINSPISEALQYSFAMPFKTIEELTGVEGPLRQLWQNSQADLLKVGTGDWAGRQAIKISNAKNTIKTAAKIFAEGTEKASLIGFGAFSAPEREYASAVEAFGNSQLFRTKLDGSMQWLKVGSLKGGKAAQAILNIGVDLVVSGSILGLALGTRPGNEIEKAYADYRDQLDHRGGALGYALSLVTPEINDPYAGSIRASTTGFSLNPFYIARTNIDPRTGLRVFDDNGQPVYRNFNRNQGDTPGAVGLKMGADVLLTSAVLALPGAALAGLAAKARGQAGAAMAFGHMRSALTGGLIAAGIVAATVTVDELSSDVLQAITPSLTGGTSIGLLPFGSVPIVAALGGGLITSAYAGGYFNQAKNVASTKKLFTTGPTGLTAVTNPLIGEKSLFKAAAEGFDKGFARGVKGGLVVALGAGFLVQQGLQFTTSLADTVKFFSYAALKGEAPKTEVVLGSGAYLEDVLHQAATRALEKGDWTTYRILNLEAKQNRLGPEGVTARKQQAFATQLGDARLAQVALSADLDGSGGINFSIGLQVPILGIGTNIDKLFGVSLKRRPTKVGYENANLDWFNKPLFEAFGYQVGITFNPGTNTEALLRGLASAAPLTLIKPLGQTVAYAGIRIAARAGAGKFEQQLGGAIAGIGLGISGNNVVGTFETVKKATKAILFGSEKIAQDSFFAAWKAGFMGIHQMFAPDTLERHMEAAAAAAGSIKSKIASRSPAKLIAGPVGSIAFGLALTGISYAAMSSGELGGEGSGMLIGSYLGLRHTPWLMKNAAMIANHDPYRSSIKQFALNTRELVASKFDFSSAGGARRTLAQDGFDKGYENLAAGYARAEAVFERSMYTKAGELKLSAATREERAFKKVYQMATKLGGSKAASVSTMTIGLGLASWYISSFQSGGEAGPNPRGAIDALQNIANIPLIGTGMAKTLQYLFRVDKNYLSTTDWSQLVDAYGGKIRGQEGVLDLTSPVVRQDDGVKEQLKGIMGLWKAAQGAGYAGQTQNKTLGIGEIGRSLTSVNGGTYSLPGNTYIQLSFTGADLSTSTSLLPINQEATASKRMLSRNKLMFAALMRGDLNEVARQVRQYRPGLMQSEYRSMSVAIDRRQLEELGKSPELASAQAVRMDMLQWILKAPTDDIQLYFSGIGRDQDLGGSGRPSRFVLDPVANFMDPRKLQNAGLFLFQRVLGKGVSDLFKTIKPFFVGGGEYDPTSGLTAAIDFGNNEQQIQTSNTMRGPVGALAFAGAVVVGVGGGSYLFEKTIGRRTEAFTALRRSKSAFDNLEVKYRNYGSTRAKAVDTPTGFKAGSDGLSFIDLGVSVRNSPRASNFRVTKIQGNDVLVRSGVAKTDTLTNSIDKSVQKYREVVDKVVERSPTMQTSVTTANATAFFDEFLDDSAAGLQTKLDEFTRLIKDNADLISKEFVTTNNPLAELQNITSGSPNNPLLTQLEENLNTYKQKLTDFKAKTSLNADDLVEVNKIRANFLEDLNNLYGRGASENVVNISGLLGVEVETGKVYRGRIEEILENLTSVTGKSAATSGGVLRSTLKRFGLKPNVKPGSRNLAQPLADFAAELTGFDVAFAGNALNSPIFRSAVAGSAQLTKKAADNFLYGLPLLGIGLDLLDTRRGEDYRKTQAVNLAETVGLTVGFDATGLAASWLINGALQFAGVAAFEVTGGWAATALAVGAMGLGAINDTLKGLAPNNPVSGAFDAAVRGAGAAVEVADRAIISVMREKVLFGKSGADLIVGIGGAIGSVPGVKQVVQGVNTVFTQVTTFALDAARQAVDDNPGNLIAGAAQGLVRMLSGRGIFDEQADMYSPDVLYASRTYKGSPFFMMLEEDKRAFDWGSDALLIRAEYAQQQRVELDSKAIVSRYFVHDSLTQGVTGIGGEGIDSLVVNTLYQSGGGVQDERVAARFRPQNQISNALAYVLETKADLFAHELGQIHNRMIAKQRIKYRDDNFLPMLMGAVAAGGVAYALFKKPPTPPAGGIVLYRGGKGHLPGGKPPMGPSPDPLGPLAPRPRPLLDGGGSSGIPFEPAKQGSLGVGGMRAPGVRAPRSTPTEAPKVAKPKASRIETQEVLKPKEVKSYGRQGTGSGVIKDVMDYMFSAGKSSIKDLINKSVEEVQTEWKVLKGQLGYKASTTRTYQTAQGQARLNVAPEPPRPTPKEPLRLGSGETAIVPFRAKEVGIVPTGQTSSHTELPNFTRRNRTPEMEPLNPELLPTVDGPKVAEYGPSTFAGKAARAVRESIVDAWTKIRRTASSIKRMYQSSGIQEGYWDVKLFGLTDYIKESAAEVFHELKILTGKADVNEAINPLSKDGTIEFEVKSRTTRAVPGLRGQDQAFTTDNLEASFAPDARRTTAGKAAQMLRKQVQGFYDRNVRPVQEFIESPMAGLKKGAKWLDSKRKDLLGYLKEQTKTIRFMGNLVGNDARMIFKEGLGSFGKALASDMKEVWAFLRSDSLTEVHQGSNSFKSVAEYLDSFDRKAKGFKSHTFADRIYGGKQTGAGYVGQKLAEAFKPRLNAATSFARDFLSRPGQNLRNYWVNTDIFLKSNAPGLRKMLSAIPRAIGKELGLVKNFGVLGYAHRAILEMHESWQTLNYEAVKAKTNRSVSTHGDVVDVQYEPIHGPERQLRAAVGPDTSVIDVEFKDVKPARPELPAPRRLNELPGPGSRQKLLSAPSESPLGSTYSPDNASTYDPRRAGDGTTNPNRPKVESPGGKLTRFVGEEVGDRVHNAVLIDNFSTKLTLPGKLFDAFTRGIKPLVDWTKGAFRNRRRLPSYVRSSLSELPRDFYKPVLSNIAERLRGFGTRVINFGKSVAEFVRNIPNKIAAAGDYAHNSVLEAGDILDNWFRKEIQQEAPKSGGDWVGFKPKEQLRLGVGADSFYAASEINTASNSGPLEGTSNPLSGLGPEPARDPFKTGRAPEANIVKYVDKDYYRDAPQEQYSPFRAVNDPEIIDVKTSYWTGLGKFLNSVRESDFGKWTRSVNDSLTNGPSLSAQMRSFIAEAQTMEDPRSELRSISGERLPVSEIIKGRLLGDGAEGAAFSTNKSVYKVLFAGRAKEAGSVGLQASVDAQNAAAKLGLSVEVERYTVEPQSFEDFPGKKYGADLSGDVLKMSEIDSTRFSSLETLLKNNKGNWGRLQGALDTHIKPALDRLADSGYIHKDPNPGNIFISKKGEVLFIDFGYSKDIRGATPQVLAQARELQRLKVDHLAKTVYGSLHDTSLFTPEENTKYAARVGQLDELIKGSSEELSSIGQNQKLKPFIWSDVFQKKNIIGAGVEADVYRAPGSDTAFKKYRGYLGPQETMTTPEAVEVAARLGIGPKSTSFRGPESTYMKGYNQPVVAMEFLEGYKTLDSKYEGKTVPETVLNKVDSAVRRLNFAGFTHDDLHMGNVMVNDIGDVKLIDVGEGTKLSTLNARDQEIKIRRQFIQFDQSLRENYKKGRESRVEELASTSRLAMPSLKRLGAPPSPRVEGFNPIKRLTSYVSSKLLESAELFIDLDAMGQHLVDKMSNEVIDPKSYENGKFKEPPKFAGVIKDKLFDPADAGRFNRVRGSIRLSASTIFASLFSKEGSGRGARAFSDVFQEVFHFKQFQEGLAGNLDLAAERNQLADFIKTVKDPANKAHLEKVLHLIDTKQYNAGGFLAEEAQAHFAQYKFGINAAQKIIDEAGFTSQNALKTAGQFMKSAPAILGGLAGKALELKIAYDLGAEFIDAGNDKFMNREKNMKLIGFATNLYAFGKFGHPLTEVLLKGMSGKSGTQPGMFKAFGVNMLAGTVMGMLGEKVITDAIDLVDPTSKRKPELGDYIVDVGGMVAYERALAYGDSAQYKLAKEVAKFKFGELTKKYPRIAEAFEEGGVLGKLDTNYLLNKAQFIPLAWSVASNIPAFWSAGVSDAKNSLMTMSNLFLGSHFILDDTRDANKKAREGGREIAGNIGALVGGRVVAGGLKSLVGMKYKSKGILGLSMILGGVVGSVLGFNKGQELYDNAPVEKLMIATLQVMSHFDEGKDAFEFIKAGGKLENLLEVYYGEKATLRILQGSVKATGTIGKILDNVVTWKGFATEAVKLGAKEFTEGVVKGNTEFFKRTGEFLKDFFKEKLNQANQKWWDMRLDAQKGFDADWFAKQAVKGEEGVKASWYSRFGRKAVNRIDKAFKFFEDVKMPKSISTAFSNISAFHEAHMTNVKNAVSSVWDKFYQPKPVYGPVPRKGLRLAGRIKAFGRASGITDSIKYTVNQVGSVIESLDTKLYSFLHSKPRTMVADIGDLKSSVAEKIAAGFRNVKSRVSNFADQFAKSLPVGIQKPFETIKGRVSTSVDWVGKKLIAGIDFTGKKIQDYKEFRKFRAIENRANYERLKARREKFVDEHIKPNFTKLSERYGRFKTNLKSTLSTAATNTKTAAIDLYDEFKTTRLGGVIHGAATWLHDTVPAVAKLRSAVKAEGILKGTYSAAKTATKSAGTVIARAAPLLNFLPLAFSGMEAMKTGFRDKEANREAIGDLGGGVAGIAGDVVAGAMFTASAGMLGSGLALMGIGAATGATGVGIVPGAGEFIAGGLLVAGGLLTGAAAAATMFLAPVMGKGVTQFLFDTFTGDFDRAGKDFKSGMQIIGDNAYKAITDPLGAVGGFVNGTIDVAKGLWDIGGQGLKATGRFIGDVANATPGALSAVGSAIWEAPGQLLRATGSAIWNTPGAVASGIGWAANGLGSMAGAAMQGLGWAAKGIFEGTGSVLSQGLNAVGRGTHTLLDVVTYPLVVGWDLAGKGLNALGNWLMPAASAAELTPGATSNTVGRGYRFPNSLSVSIGKSAPGTNNGFQQVSSYLTGRRDEFAAGLHHRKTQLKSALHGIKEKFVNKPLAAISSYFGGRRDELVAGFSRKKEQIQTLFSKAKASYIDKTRSAVGSFLTSSRDKVYGYFGGLKDTFTAGVNHRLTQAQAAASRAKRTVVGELNSAVATTDRFIYQAKVKAQNKFAGASATAMSGAGHLLKAAGEYILGAPAYGSQLSPEERKRKAFHFNTVLAKTAQAAQAKSNKKLKDTKVSKTLHVEPHGPARGTEKSVSEHINDALLSVGEFFGKAWQGLVNGVNSAANSVKQGISDAGQKIQSGFQNVVNGVQGAFTPGFSTTLNMNSVGIQQGIKNHKFDAGFLDGVQGMSGRLGLDPNHVLAVMGIESMFNAHDKNKYGYTGLVQIGEDSLGDMRKLGIVAKDFDTEKLKKMGQVEQLGVVEKYLAYRIKYFANREGANLKDPGNLYLMIAAPALAGKADDYVYQTRSLSSRRIADANPAWDLNHDHKVTIGEIRQSVRQNSNAGVFLQSNGKPSNQLISATGTSSGQQVAQGSSASNSRLLSVTMANIGTLRSDTIPGTSNGNLGCAAIVNTLVNAAYGKPITGTSRRVGLGTSEMYETLRKTATEVDKPMPGDVVISPSGPKGIGHVGIVLEGGKIASNSSKIAKLQQNYTLDSWGNKYHKLGVHYFRLGGQSSNQVANQPKATTVSSSINTHTDPQKTAKPSPGNKLAKSSASVVANGQVTPPTQKSLGQRAAEFVLGEPAAAAEIAPQAKPKTIPVGAKPAQPGHSTPNDFFLNNLEAAVQEQNRSGVPAEVTLAQAALESGYGKSGLAKSANNFFGIKGKGPAGSVNMRTGEEVNGRHIYIMADFRKYNNSSEGFKDHSDFLTKNQRYKEAFKTKDPIEFAKRIAAAGYATEHDYASQLEAIIRKNNLQQLVATAPNKTRVATVIPAQSATQAQGISQAAPPTSTDTSKGESSANSSNTDGSSQRIFGVRVPDVKAGVKDSTGYVQVGWYQDSGSMASMMAKDTAMGSSDGFVDDTARMYRF
jgi:flagellum-specific peptidoglycan hydrolase FlgJ/tRNA A-37 threonylcarbamoyl transferase component Bud32